VFNYYLPNHVPGGELQTYKPRGRVPNRTVYAPEFEIMTSVAANRIANRFRTDIQRAELRLNYRQYLDGEYTDVPFTIPFDFAEEIAMAADPAALVDHLDILLCHGTLGDTAKTALINNLTSITQDSSYRVRGAVIALVNAPDCAIHE
jgi:hypothetical protein